MQKVILQFIGQIKSVHCTVVIVIGQILMSLIAALTSPSLITNVLSLISSLRIEQSAAAIISIPPHAAAGPAATAALPKPHGSELRHVPRPSRLPRLIHEPRRELLARPPGLVVATTLATSSLDQLKWSDTRSDRLWPA